MLFPYNGHRYLLASTFCPRPPPWGLVNVLRILFRMIGYVSAYETERVPSDRVNGGVWVVHLTLPGSFQLELWKLTAWALVPLAQRRNCRQGRVAPYGRRDPAGNKPRPRNLWVGWVRERGYFQTPRTAPRLPT